MGRNVLVGVAPECLVKGLNRSGLGYPDGAPDGRERDVPSRNSTI
jgi:hypothetical protein